ncbi:MAG TPA: AtpZ/AtpI family protein [Pyrinomonadaceae bacterium]|jgi:F0F1-type ATP synthase assembly protein I|nr:AtpZ/AtpI family protein [Chloracidobacterium sp.]MBP9935118.1 AtpZ/AtpI family protein [Pyrinomonadaceae bacterium]MBK7803455.1 AtpZ/AtpI family protein [Chloracidobacterium sp.]MBK9438704.1 AtpZ/AtpI family protein [Chloracidobacterium sp.]MBK9766762.1 AtpZ/AtpI family protein [Chloracidobacterium sp.]
MDETNKNASGSENIDDADLNEWLNDWPIDAADPDHLDSAVDTALGGGELDGVSTPAAEPPFETPFLPIEYTPISQDETIRRTGLAWSAGIVFFASIAFTLFLGWLADLVLGSSPWGLVGGIVLGSIIGFIQFFRLTSQIFGSGNSKPVIKSLLSHDDDDN